MSSEPAGTPETTTPQSASTQSAAAGQDGSEQVTVSKQFKDEALKSWKPAAEKVNQLEAQLAETQRRFDELQRQQYNGGQTATDPTVEMVAQLKEQAQYDPVAKATLYNMEMVARTQAEAWLSGQMADVPAHKRAQVAEYVRSKGYQVGAADALRVLTDPDSATLAQKNAELQAELERLRGARPNGVSPSGVTPASMSAADGKVSEEVTPQEYAETLRRGGPQAAALIEAVKAGTTKFKR